jgi:CRP/FNR family cyclic AMP-dependent transcriptional regulator
MFQIATEETFQDGQIIFEEGSAGDWVYLLESGAVEIYKRAGEEEFVIEVLQPGDVFGEIAFFAKIPRTASVRAVGTTTLGVIDRTFLDEEFNRLSGDFRMLLKSLVLKLLKNNENALQPKLHRKDPRVPRVLNLRYKSRKGFIKAFSSNLSSGGIFIRTPKPFAIGERFVLNLILPDTSESLKIRCKVSWSQTDKEGLAKHPPGMGVKFIELSPADSQRLKEELIKNGS